MMQIQDPLEGQTFIEVRWYFAPEGAKVFRGVNAFSSGIWDREKEELPPLLGDQPPYARWSNGKNTGGYLGQCMIGTPHQFQFGLSAADLVAPILAIPECCKPRRMTAGEVDGAGVRVPLVTLTAGEVLGQLDPQISSTTAGEVLGQLNPQITSTTAGEVLGQLDPQSGQVTTAGEVLGQLDPQSGQVTTAGEVDGGDAPASSEDIQASEVDGARQEVPPVILTAGEVDGGDAPPPASSEDIQAGEVDGAEIPGESIQAGEVDGTGDVSGPAIFRIPLGSASDIGPTSSLTIPSIAVPDGCFLIVNVLVTPALGSISVSYDGLSLTSITGNLTLPGTGLNYYQFSRQITGSHFGSIVVSSTNPLSSFLVNAIAWANLQGGGSTDQIVQSSGTSAPAIAGPSGTTAIPDEGVTAAVAAVYTSGSVNWQNGFVNGGLGIGLVIGGQNVVLLEAFKVLSTRQVFTPEVTGLSTVSWVTFGVSYP